MKVKVVQINIKFVELSSLYHYTKFQRNRYVNVWTQVNVN